MYIPEEITAVKPDKDTTFTIGVFDGVHIGHRHLLKRVRDVAREHGWLSGVITFRSHPHNTLHTDKLLLIDELENRIRLIKNVGIDIVVVLTFTEELRGLTAKEFLDVLVKNLRIKYLIGGPDFALGRDREGNIDRLREYGKQMGFDVEVVPPFIFEGWAVRSSLIRRTLIDGDISRASTLLGYTYSLSGPIVPGDQRGRQLGFPTVNLEVNPDLVIPANGVYATIAILNDTRLPAVTNIGTHPTFGGNKRLVETHVIDYDLKLTGQRVTIDFIKRLRDEKKFGSPGELVTQIKKDVDRAKAILKRKYKGDA
jgi:riboflavin kinase/FMN adenylyltransferase